MEKRLPKMGVSITWFMRGADTSLGIRAAVWRYSRVLLMPSLRPLARGRAVLEHLLLVGAAPLLLWRIAALRPAAIFVRNDPLYLLLGLIAGRLLRRPVIFQLSHLKEEDLLMRASAASGARAMQLRCKGYLGKALRNLLIGQVDRLLVISATMRQSLAAQRRHLPPTFVFPLGVDIGVESDAVDTVLPKISFERYVIYVGTMARTRQPELMIEAFRQVRAVHSGVGLVLVGGGGEPQERERLKRYVENNGAATFVQFIPDVPRALLPSLIRSAVCGLSVMPAEGVNRMISPTKLMEYLQFECPVVASRGIPEQDEIVRSSQGGLLVSFEAVAVASAINALLEQPALRDSMGRHGRTYIEAHRDYALFAQRMFEILTSGREHTAAADE